MKRKELLFVPVLVSLACMPLAYGRDDAVETTQFERLSQSAQQAFDREQYKKAESLWTRALSALEDEARSPDQALASSLKRLGETLLKEAKYPEAQTNLQHAATVYGQLAVTDAELSADQALLSQTYKPIDVTSLGKLANDVLSHAAVSSMCILKTALGNRVQIMLPERLTKHIDNKDVDQIGLDKVVTFDITSLADGAVKIENIKGLRVRAKYWVDIVSSWFKPGESGTHTADVTAQKMGIRKTVSAHLNDDAYAPVAGLVSQLSWSAAGAVEPHPASLIDSASGLSNGNGPSSGNAQSGISGQSSSSGPQPAEPAAPQTSTVTDTPSSCTAPLSISPDNSLDPAKSAIPTTGTGTATPSTMEASDPATPAVAPATASPTGDSTGSTVTVPASMH